MSPPASPRNQDRALTRRRATGSVAATFSALLLILVLLFAAFVWPWLPQIVDVRDAFPYAPYAHGDATVRVTLDAEFTPFAWTSDNLVTIPSGQIFEPDFPAILSAYLMNLIPELAQTGTLPRDTQLFRNHSRTMLADGTVTDSETYVLRRAGDDANAQRNLVGNLPVGDAIVGVTIPGIDQPLLYNPPLSAHIGDRAPSSTTQHGSLAETFNYTFTTQQRPRSTISTPFGSWENCREVEATLHIANTDVVILNEANTTVYCTGQGLVAQTTHNADGSDYHAYLLHNIGTLSPSALAPMLPPFAALTPARPAEVDQETWQATEFAESGGRTHTAVNTIPPTFVATTPPMLLSAARDGPLVATNARLPVARLWEFHTGGTVHTQPFIDVNTGVIYFGSSDKHLYALTQQGLLLWKYALHDNMVARPLVVDEQLLAVAEDGTLIGLDKLTGGLHWQQDLGSTVVGSPAHLVASTQSLVIVGSEAGQLTAHDARSGEQLWSIALDAPIRVSPVGTIEAVFVVTTAPSLYKFASDGSQIWRTELDSDTVAPPAVNETHLFVVENRGWLTAYDRATGALSWRSDEPRYTARPIWVAPSLIVATSDSAVVAIDANGEIQREWQLPPSFAADEEQEDASADTPTFGPTAGGGAIWLGDLGARIYRLGPPIVAP